MLTIADCRRRIQLEFFLGTVRARRESLRKLDLLLNVLGSFRKVLLAEAQLITEYERAEKRSKPTAKTRKLRDNRNQKTPTPDAEMKP